MLAVKLWTSLLEHKPHGALGNMLDLHVDTDNLHVDADNLHHACEIWTLTGHNHVRAVGANVASQAQGAD